MRTVYIVLYYACLRNRNYACMHRLVHVFCFFTDIIPMLSDCQSPWSNNSMWSRDVLEGTQEGHGIVDGNGGWWWAQFNKKKDPLPYGRPAWDWLEVQVFKCRSLLVRTNCWWLCLFWTITLHEKLTVYVWCLTVWCCVCTALPLSSWRSINQWI